MNEQRKKNRSEKKSEDKKTRPSESRFFYGLIKSKRARFDFAFLIRQPHELVWHQDDFA